MSISSRSVTLATILVLLISAGGSAADAEGPLYRRKENLQKTLLTTRQRYAAWLAEQPAARAAVEFSPWLATPPLPSADAEKHVRPAEGVDPNAKLE